MLENAPVMTMLPVVDMNRAREFYERKLGLRSAGTSPQGNQLYKVSGTTLALYQRERPSTADHTLVSFQVQDISSVVDQLSRRGVQFEDYDFPGLKTVNKVCVLGAEKAAWFKDTEGNILCIHQDL
jgi:predicted enzyme related to lactoylglutathione lyase